MAGEYISRSQLLLQYYTALAELEQESRVMVACAGATAQASAILQQVECRPQPIFAQDEVRPSL